MLCRRCYFICPSHKLHRASHLQQSCMQRNCLVINTRQFLCLELPYSLVMWYCHFRFCFNCIQMFQWQGEFQRVQYSETWYLSSRRHCSRTSQCLILYKVVSRFRVCKLILRQTHQHVRCYLLSSASFSEDLQTQGVTTAHYDHMLLFPVVLLLITNML